jgi:hypothetical protein
MVVTGMGGVGKRAVLHGAEAEEDVVWPLVYGKQGELTLKVMSCGVPIWLYCVMSSILRAYQKQGWKVLKS